MEDHLYIVKVDIEKAFDSIAQQGLGDLIMRIRAICRGKLDYGSGFSKPENSLFT